MISCSAKIVELLAALIADANINIVRGEIRLDSHRQRAPHHSFNFKSRFANRAFTPSAWSLLNSPN